MSLCPFYFELYIYFYIQSLKFVFDFHQMAISNLVTQEHKNKQHGSSSQLLKKGKSDKGRRLKKSCQCQISIFRGAEDEI